MDTTTLSNSVTEAFFCRKSVENFKDKVIAPDLTSEIINDENKLRDYFQKLRKKTTEEKTVDGLSFYFLKHEEHKVPTEEYIIFVPVKLDDEETFCLLFRYTNLYYVGIQNSDCEATVFHEKAENGGGWSIDGYKKFVECMKFYGINKIKTVPIGDSYPALQELAQTTRAQLKLGRKKLIETLRFMSKSVWDDRKILAVSILYITQFFCEPLRIKSFAQWIFENISADDGNGKFIPLIFLLLQYGWGAASESILRRHYNVQSFGVFLRDNEEALPLSELEEHYGVLKYYSKEEDLISSPPLVRNNMLSKYVESFPQFSTFGKYYKSSIPLKISDDEEWEVSAIIHVFHKHLILDYTYEHIRNEMWNIKDVSLSVSVDYSVYEDEPEEINNIFVPCIPQKHMFIAVQKPADGITHARFLTALSFYQEKDDSSIDNKTAEEKVEIKLKNLNLYGTYCIQKLPVKYFEEQWKDMGQNLERENVYVFRLRESDNHLSSTMEIVKNILGMYLCKEILVTQAVSPAVLPEAVLPAVLPEAVPEVLPEAVPEVTKSITCLLSGQYTGNATVLVKVSICFTESDFIDSEAVEMNLTYKCADSYVGTYIHGTVEDWLTNDSDSYGRKEYSYGSLAAEEGLLPLACRA